MHKSRSTMWISHCAKYNFSINTIFRHYASEKIVTDEQPYKSSYMIGLFIAIQGVLIIFVSFYIQQNFSLSTVMALSSKMYS